MSIADHPIIRSPILELFHGALHELLGVVELLDDQRDVHLRLPGEPIAPAIDAVLPDERERIGEQIERHGEAAARGPHHRLVMLERVAMLVEGRTHWRRHLRGGFAGRSSTRLARLRELRRSRSTTTSATSSADAFQSAPFCSSPLANPVATDPGIT